jgi:hypothetical protein
VAIVGLKDKLAGASEVAVTTDLWTSAAQDAYLGLTVHYVTSDGDVVTSLLDCIEMDAAHHTAEDIADMMRDRFSFWGLSISGKSKVMAAVADNGSNMVKALNEYLQLPIVIGCFAHTVHLAVMKGMLLL